MRTLILAACILVAGSVAAEDPFVSGDALREVVQKKCADGCVIFSREDAARFEEQLSMILSARMREAFDAGQANQKQACASLI